MPSTSRDYLVGMRKLSDYFKPVPNSQSQKPQRTDHGDIPPGSSSPLSECLSIPTPSPPPRTIRTAPSTSRGTTQNNVSGLPGKYTIRNKGQSYGDLAAPKNVIPDSEGEDSNSSLEDIDMIFFKHKGTRPVKRDLKKQKGPALVQSTINSKADVDIPKYTFSLDALISEKAKDAEREEILKRTEALLARAEDEGEGEDYGHVAFGPQKELIDAAVGSDAGDKVLSMLNRREAWRQEYIWYFLDRSEECCQSRIRSPFPTSSLKGWSTQMKEPTIRNKMFVSGFVHDMCLINHHHNLPVEVVSWLLDELVLEMREDLSFAYMKTLGACMRTVELLLDSPRLAKLFMLLGAKEESIDTRNPVTLLAHSASKVNCAKFERLWNLKLLVRFIGNAAAYLSYTAIQTSVEMLIRLSLDDQVTISGDLLVDIEQSLYSLLMTVGKVKEGDSWITFALNLSQSLISTFTEPKVQNRLLKILPITSPWTHLFRRRLALAFLFDNSVYINLRNSQPVDITSFSELFGMPQFTVRHDTNYGNLKALVEIFDIAFHDGGVPGASHNREVEGVAVALKDMSSKIRDTGMASLERTEAKQVIELAQFRLQFALAKGIKGISVLDRHFFVDSLGEGMDGKKQTLLHFATERKD